jgi:hypothetical protein
MPTAREYRQQPENCLELVKETKDLYAIEAMMELAEEYNKAAEQLEHDRHPRPH